MLTRRRRAIVVVLGLAATGTLVGIWAKRIELFVVPATWREAREQWKIVKRFGWKSEYPLNELRAMEAFEETMNRLLALQDARHVPGVRFRLDRVRCLDREVREFATFWTRGEGAARRFVFISSRGRTRHGREGQFTGPGASWRELDDPELSGIDITTGNGAYAIDEDGPVFVGYLDGGGLLPNVTYDPTSSSPDSGLAIPRDARRDRFLDSSRAGQILRGLFLYGREAIAERENSRIARLLDHPHPLVRARAASLIAPGPDARDMLVPLLADSSSTVRLSALRAFLPATAFDWCAPVAALARDGNPRIATEATRALTASVDPYVAADAIARTIRERESAGPDRFDRYDFGYLHAMQLFDLAVVGKPEFVEVLLSLVGSRYADDAARVLRAFDHSALAPHVERVREIVRRGPDFAKQDFELVLASIGTDDDLERIISSAWVRVRPELLLKAIAKRATRPAKEVLAWIHELTRTPEHAENDLAARWTLLRFGEPIDEGPTIDDLFTADWSNLGTHFACEAVPRDAFRRLAALGDTDLAVLSGHALDAIQSASGEAASITVPADLVTRILGLDVNGWVKLGFIAQGDLGPTAAREAMRVLEADADIAPWLLLDNPEILALPGVVDIPMRWLARWSDNELLDSDIEVVLTAVLFASPSPESETLDAALWHLVKSSTNSTLGALALLALHARGDAMAGDALRGRVIADHGWLLRTIEDVELYGERPLRPAIRRRLAELE